METILETEGSALNVMMLQESRQYTVLAYAAFKNHPQCFKVLFNHAKKYNLKQASGSNKLALSRWANKPTDEKFTCLHFATYHGNQELILVIVEEMGADYHTRNIYGANVLHIASQGDQPAPLYYFAKVKTMNINDTDNRDSTPLHWACYSRSEFALSYILAMEVNLEAKDQAGYTPLHLAIKSVGQLKSTRPVRALLLKGANRSATNLNNDTCVDIIGEEVTDNMRNELIQMLEVPRYLECFMVKTPLVPLRQNHKTQLLFVILFLIILIA